MFMHGGIYIRCCEPLHATTLSLLDQLPFSLTRGPAALKKQKKGNNVKLKACALAVLSSSSLFQVVFLLDQSKMWID